MKNKGNKENMKNKENMTTEEVKQQISKIEYQIEYLEDCQGFAPRALKNQLWELRAKIENS